MCNNIGYKPDHVNFHSIYSQNRNLIKLAGHVGEQRSCPSTTKLMHDVSCSLSTTQNLNQRLTVYGLDEPVVKSAKYDLINLSIKILINNLM